MTPVQASKTRTPPTLLSQLDEWIIRAVGTYKFMTREDIGQLLGAGGQSTLRDRLRKLSGGDCVAGQYLYRSPLAGRGVGEKPRVYCLGVKGRQMLCWDGYYRPSKTLSLSFGTLAHALALTRFCIAAAAFCRGNHAFTLLETQLSYAMAHDPPRIRRFTNGKEETVAVIPDAFLCFARADGGGFPVAVEIDRGSSGSRRIKAALHARIELLRCGEYCRFFGQEAVRFAYLTTAGVARRDALESWACDVVAEAIAEKQYHPGWLEKFYFTSCAYEEIAAELFRDPVWYRPDSESALPLLSDTPQRADKETTDGDPS